MNYAQYIASAHWKTKRQQRLEIDGRKCVVCKSDHGLSVHHLTYANLGNEDALRDLVTVCSECHHLFDTIERYQRYARRKHTVNPIEVQDRKAIDNGLGNSRIQIDFYSTATDAQRANGKPAEQVVETDQSDFIKAREDRR